MPAVGSVNRRLVGERAAGYVEWASASGRPVGERAAGFVEWASVSGRPVGKWAAGSWTGGRGR